MRVGRKAIFCVVFAAQVALANLPATNPDPHEVTPGHHETGHGGHAATGSGWIRVDDENAVYRDGRTRTRYAFFNPFLNPEPGWDESRIGFLVRCRPVKVGRFDPITNPDGSPSHHLHEFYGNRNISATTSTQKLVDTPRSRINCTDVNDKSSYWNPVVYQDGVRVAAETYSAYYRSPTPDVEPMPLGLRIIAGDPAATANQPEHVGFWVSERDQSDLARFPIDCHERRPTPECAGTVGRNEMMTRVKPGLEIILVINFPNCWDGAHLDSPDHKSHMAYPNAVTGACPASHPVKVPQLTTRTRYDVDGGPGFALSSGPWYTFHQDFWNAWSPDQQAELIDRCIGASLQCRRDATPKLVRLGQYTSFVPL